MTEIQKKVFGLILDVFYLVVSGGIVAADGLDMWSNTLLTKVFLSSQPETMASTSHQALSWPTPYRRLTQS